MQLKLTLHILAAKLLTHDGINKNLSIKQLNSWDDPVPLVIFTVWNRENSPAGLICNQCRF